MASVFAGLLTTLRGTREGVLPSADLFPALNVEQLATELRLVARGQEDGRKNLPTDGGETAAEADVRAEITRRAAKAASDLQAQLDLYEGRIRSAMLATELRTAIEAAGERALSDFKVQATEDLDRLFGYSEAVRNHEAELHSFKAVHGLSRGPRMPHSIRLRWAVIVFLFITEIAVNGTFFAEGSSMGFIGGVVEASVLSFLNIATAVGCAMFVLPYVWHRSATKRGLGITGVLIYSGLLVFLNLVVGHYRDLFASQAGRVPVHTLWNHVTSAPIELADAKSLFLVALGISFALIAVADASGLRDPYPGYGKLGQRRNEAIASFSDHRGRCLVDLRARRDEAIDDMTEVIGEVRSKEHDLQLAVKGRERLRQQYLAFVDHLNDAQLRLHQRYREANLAIRAERAGPRWQPVLPVRPVEVESGSVHTVLEQEALRHVIERMEFFIRAISSEFDTQAERYPSVDDLVRPQVRETASV